MAKSKMKPIVLPGQSKAVSSGKKTAIDTSSFNKIIEQAHARENALAEERRKISEQQAQQQPVSLGNWIKQNLTLDNIKSVGKQVYQSILRGGAKTALTAGEFARTAYRGPLKDQTPSGRTISVYGTPVKSAQRGIYEAGQQLAKGEINTKQYLGKSAEEVLDVVSTVYTPGRVFKTFKGGKIVRGILENAAIGGAYGSLYGAAGGAQENKDAKGIGVSALKGFAIGAGAGGILGGITSGAGSIISRVAKRRKELFIPPSEGSAPKITEIIGKAKNPVDYVASRPNLKIVPLNNIGKDLEGNNIVSRFEWDNRKNTGVILMSDNAGDDALAHEIGHYIDKQKPDLAQRYQDEVAAVSGGRGNLNEDFADTVKRIITEPSTRTKAPGLTKEIQNLGMDLNAKAFEPAPAPVKVSKNKEIKTTIPSTTPTAVARDAQTVYRKARKSGFSPVEASQKAAAKVDTYEKFVKRAAKDSPILQSILEARKPEYGPTPKKKVKTEGINMKSVNTSEDTEDIIKSVFEENKQFKSVRPSRTNKDIQEGARAVGIDPNDEKALKNLLKWMPNANVAVKVKQLMVDSASDLMNYLKNVDTGNLTAAEQKTIRDKFLRTQALAKTFAGLRTESSHLLRSMGVEVFEGENMAEMAVKLKQALGESGDDAIKFLGKTKDLAQPPTKTETALAVWYNMILSGWKTWARNITDTLANITTETLSKAFNPVTAREVPSFVANMLRSLPTSFSNAWKVMKGDKEFLSRISYRKEHLPYFENKKLNLMLTEVSGRMLSAQDQAMSTPIQEATKAIVQFDKAMQKAGIAMEDRIKLNDAISEQSAERATYRNKPMGNVGVISTSLDQINHKIPAARIVLTFLRVASNVIDRKVDYLPFVNLWRTFGKKYIRGETDIILKKSGIDPQKWDSVRGVVEKRLYNQQLGRLVLGTATSIAAYGLASQGLISAAGPPDLNARKQKEATGWRPFSVKIGNTWVPYTYFGPLSGIFAAAGSIYEANEYHKQNVDVSSIIANGLLGFGRAMLSMSFLSGTADLLDVINAKSDPMRYFRNLATGLLPIPAMWSQTSQLFDRRQIDIQTWGEAIKYKLGLTKEIPSKLTALGEEIRTDLIYGMSPSEEKYNLNKKYDSRGLVVTIPDKRTKIEGQELTREQLFEYTMRRGELIRKNSEKFFQMYDREKSPDKKEKIFKAFIDDASDQAKSEVQKKYRIPVKSSGVTAASLFKNTKSNNPLKSGTSQNPLKASEETPHVTLSK